MTTIINTKLGENRGKARIWLEGGKLAREGYVPGGQYDLSVSDGKIVIKPNTTGTYTVSRKTRNGKLIPVIDICRDDLAQLFEGVSLLRVQVTKGRIVIEAHQQHQLIQERVTRFIDRIRTGEPLRVCSLFAGGGVLDKAIHAGFERVGVNSKIGVSVEIESAYVEASLANNPELYDDQSVVIHSAIEHVRLGHRTPQMDVLCAGIPCTGASRSGRTKNKLKHAEEHEAAGAMFFHCLKFIELINPAVVLLENVPEYANTASMAVIRSVLASLGYVLQERVMGGNEFGALENRKRLCAVAISKGLEGHFDLEAVVPHVTKPESLNEVLQDVAEDSDRWKPYDYLDAKAVRDKAAGKGFARQLLTGSESHCGTIGKSYAKGRSTEPFIIHPNNPALSRLLTPVEHCRVKGAPEQLVEGMPDTTAQEVMGQAVIFTKFEAVAMHLGRSSRTAAGLKNDHLMEVMVTCLDPHNDGCIGGEDLDESLALLDTTSGKIKLVASGRYKGWPMAASNEGLMLRTMQGVDVAVQLKAAGDEPECWSNDPAEVIAHVRNHGSSWMIQLTGDVLAKLRGQAVVEESRQASLAFAA